MTWSAPGRRPIISERGDPLKPFGSVIVLALVLTGCSTTRSLTVVSTNNVELSYPNGRQRVTGEDCAYNFFGIPASDHSNPSVHRAINDAASMTPDTDTMSDMTIHRDTLITFVYNHACLRVDGNAVAQTTGSSYLDAVQRDFYSND